MPETQTGLFGVKARRREAQKINNERKNTIAFCVSADEYSSYRDIYTKLGYKQCELIKIAFDRMMRDLYENGVHHFMEAK